MFAWVVVLLLLLLLLLNNFLASGVGLGLECDKPSTMVSISCGDILNLCIALILSRMALLSNAFCGMTTRLKVGLAFSVGGSGGGDGGDGGGDGGDGLLQCGGLKLLDCFWFW